MSSESHTGSIKAHDYLAAVIAAALAFVVFFITRSQSAGWHDSAELALSAWQLGASHAPGSPLHSLIGYLFSIVAEPYKATTFLSILTSSLAAGVVALLAGKLGCKRLAAIGAGALFAFVFPVWPNAVLTELYALNALCVGLLLMALWHWQQRQGSGSLLLGLAVYGLALSAYFANILLVPALAIFVWRASPQPLKPLASAIAGTTIAVGVIALVNVWLASRVPAVSEINPDSLVNTFLYMTGANHNPLAVDGVSFMLTRTVEHALSFSANFLFIGIAAGIFGIVALWKTERVYTELLLLVFLTYMGYYTLFGPGDYAYMVAPACLVFAVFCGAGFQTFGDRLNNPKLKPVAASGALVIAAALVLLQLPERLAAAADQTPERYVENTFASMPDDALLLVRWQQFTTLRYYQEVHEQRPDVKVSLSVLTPRTYNWGQSDNYIDDVTQQLCNGKQVLTDKQPNELPGSFKLVPTDIEGIKSIAGQWQQVVFANPSEENCS